MLEESNERTNTENKITKFRGIYYPAYVKT